MQNSLVVVIKDIGREVQVWISGELKAWSFSSGVLAVRKHNLQQYNLSAHAPGGYVQAAGNITTKLDFFGAKTSEQSLVIFPSSYDPAFRFQLGQIFF